MPEGNAFAGLRLPAIAAPMFLVSGPELVVASARSGIVGAMPAANARTGDDLDRWCRTIRETLAGDCPGSWSINLVANRRNPRVEHDLGVIRRHEVPLVVTALGSPAAVIEAVHSYGGLVFADVISIEQARKAATWGVDGLVLICAGAGGHTGQLSPFAFVPEVRSFWDGYIVAGGGIATGAGIRGALALGADLAYLGTRFIAAAESMASDNYRAMLVEAGGADIICTDAFTGIPNNMLRPSIVRAGIDPDNIPPACRSTLNFEDPHSGAKAWRDIWSAGHGVGAITAVEPVEAIVASLEREFRGGDAFPAPVEWRRTA
ncbi:NAD(P)H-dependent flavin oxidoreductase [Sphingopyxis granuli]|uniref:NAD(P)H-dependent flavin oxidoreductase n=1 Tax=Sphingopyxis granuli TaxID=267128 RepID=UPI001A626531|nr:nitronate monooxygenase family protein [Sphingopyxis granuli]MBL8649944.1 nitronate monooxygenase [Sphingopyxis sp.]QUM74605.1 nitronate monooxygenase [Sphingopyxis granuli]